MPTSPLDGSRPAVPLTKSMILHPKSTLRGSVTMPDPVVPGVLGSTDSGAELTPTALQHSFVPAEPPVMLELAPSQPGVPPVLGAADELTADLMDDIAMVEFQTDPGEEAVYILLQEVHTPQGIIYDMTMPQPAPQAGVLGGSEHRSGQTLRSLRCPVHRVVHEKRASSDEGQQPGVLGGAGEIIADIAGDLIFRRVLHLVRAPVNRALRDFIAAEEVAPTVLTVGAETTPDQPLAGAEAWRSRFNPEKEHNVLLFIHGFTSNTARSLPRDWVNEFGSRYDAVLAFDHPTITGDPGQNAIDLLAQVPDDVRLNVDLLAHSRGGLVARSLVELNPFTSKLHVQRLLTYGSPHSGTVLAEQARWDRLVSISLTVLSWLTRAAIPPASFIPNLLEYLLRAAGQFIFDLPGIGAMDPNSTFLKTLNAVNETELAERVQYAAIISKFDPATIFETSIREALFAMATQAFIGVPNDLIVPTESMQSIDLPTATQLGGRVFQTNVNHFSYFHDRSVCDFVNNFFLGT